MKESCYLVLKPAVLLQHLLTLDCAFKAVKLKLDLRNSVNQPLKHVLQQSDYRMYVGSGVVLVHLGFFFRQGNVRPIFRIEVNSNEATDCIHQATN